MAALKFFFFLLMKPAAVGMALLGLAGIFAPFIDPNIWWVSAFAGLFMPCILFINFFLLIFWTLHKKTWLLLPLITIIANYNYLTSIFQSPWKTLPTYTDQNTITVASYNVEGFYLIAKNDFKYDVSRLANQKPIDILCIQEHCEESLLDSATIRKRIDLPYRKVFFNRKTSWANFGISIYSRYPIVRFGSIDFNSEKNSAMWADICINNDTIRVFNNHLQTTDVSINTQKYNQYRSVKNWNGQARILVNLLESLKENFCIRAEQAKLVRQKIEMSPYPVIICGDFNDTPVSYAFNLIKGNNFTDGFRDCGKGYGHSFSGIKSLLRIDFIAYADCFIGLNYESPHFIWSDHNPIIMSLKMKK